MKTTIVHKLRILEPTVCCLGILRTHKELEGHHPHHPKARYSGNDIVGDPWLDLSRFLNSAQQRGTV